MMILTAALLLIVAIVGGVTAVTLTALSYARHLDEPDPNEDRCPALDTWTGTSNNNKGIKYPYRCTLPAEHTGPHHIPHPMPGSRSERDYWWDTPPEPHKPATKDRGTAAE